MTEMPLSHPPSIEKLASHPDLQDAVERLSPAAVTEAAQEAVARIRQHNGGGDGWPSLGRFVEVVRDVLAERDRESLRPVVNATGVLLHTNLGRAPLGAEVLGQIAEVAGGYSNLEYDISRGERGRRGTALERELCALVGSEAALVVNNNAAAVVLALSALAFGREVIVSRGELVQIGGGFRIPEILLRSGASMREVGTTNKTNIADYLAAIDDSTAVLLKVHRSNFEQSGFVSEVSIAELVAIGDAHSIPVAWDMGSGALFGMERYGIENEPTIESGLRAGADLVTASGDKLLGGPQAGLIFGRRELIERLRGDSFYRAMRPDKLTLAGLAATVAAHRAGETHERLPLYRLLAVGAESLRGRAEAIAEHARQCGLDAEVTATDDAIGGGAAPGLTIAGWGVRIVGRAPDEVARVWRELELPVIATRGDDAVVVHLRAVFPEQDQQIMRAFDALRPTTG